jgi:diacylglycerol kinase family enzyme
MDVLLLHNSTAGNEDHTEEKLVRLLKHHGYKPTYAPVNEGLANEKLLKRSEIVIAAGGDGTIRKTVTRMARRKCPVGVLPLGTANNIARSLGIGTDIGAIVASWKDLKPCDVDLGVAKGPWGKVHFIEGIGFGLIGRTMAILDSFDEHVVHTFPTAADKLHRDISVLAALTHEMPPIKARLTVGKDRTKDEFLLLEILNISRAGPGVMLARDANPMDGELNVVSVLGEERQKLVEQLEKHVAGERDATRLREQAAKKLKLVVGPCELRIDDKIVMSPKDFAALPDQRAEIDVKIEAGAVKVLCGPK